MPGSFRSICRSTVWLALGLGLVACVASAEPTAETGGPADPPPTVTEELVAPPTVAREEPTVPPALPTATESPALVVPDLGPAPDITNEVWLNTDQPLNLAALRGRVVLVEFWTFG
jgi:hypothetical protein